jgi:hypothetical protein
MNTREKPSPLLVKTLIMAGALTLTSTAALSEPEDAVKSVADQNIGHAGRDSVYAPLGKLAATPVKDPQMYGRAGGYVGADRATVLEAGPSPQSTNITVKTSEFDIGHVAQVHTYQNVPAQPEEAQAKQGGGPRSGDRFSNPQGAHGQDETAQ